MQELPKPIKRALRQLQDLAYERDLRRELVKLDQSFTDWREGKIDSFELNEQIHKHHNGRSRELWSFYSGYRDVEMTVSYAVVEGLIKEEEIPAEVLEAIRRHIAFIRSNREPEEPQAPEA